MSTSSAGTATSDPVLASCTATLAMRISSSAGGSNMLNLYYRKLSLRKEISIVLFLPFLRNLSCGVLTFFLRSTVTTYDRFAPRAWSLISFVLDPQLQPSKRTLHGSNAASKYSRYCFITPLKVILDSHWTK